jgi:hypothetical protein
MAETDVLVNGLTMLIVGLWLWAERHFPGHGTGAHLGGCFAASGPQLR